MANRKLQKVLAFGLAAATAASLLLSGCGGSDNSGSAQSETTPAAEETGASEEAAETETAEAEPTEEKESVHPAVGKEGGSTEFKYLISMPETDFPFDSWSDSPAMQEWMADCGEDITFEWEEAPISADSDYYNTLLGTGDYPDLMSPTLFSYNAAQLYDQGVALDITDLVEENMPNYMKWVEAHPEYRPQIYQNVDGAERILNIRAFSEVAEPWSSYMYRRDWILEYGKNPETGEAFTGGWQDADKTEWEDDIVFPSGETYPKYISDWEWMLPIFEEALEDQGVEDGAALTLMYRGYFSGTNHLLAGFGGTYGGWYADRDNEIKYGWTDDSDATRAYVECMHHWYEEGWIDPSFDERTNDSIFFMINQTAVFSGKVGCMVGLLESQLGNMMNNGTSELLEDVNYMAAPQPINDVYGPESVQNVDPWRYYEAGSLLGGELVVTEKAKDKDIAALLRAMDYLYGPGGENLSMIGVSNEQQEEHQYQILKDLGYDEGCCTVETNEDGEKIYVLNRKIIEDNMGVAMSLNRTNLGLNPNSRVDKQNPQPLVDAMELAVLYPGGGDITYLTNVLPPEHADAMTALGTAAGSILDVSIPDFITGRVELNDDNWESFQNSLLEQGVEEVKGYIQELQEQ